MFSQRKPLESPTKSVAVLEYEECREEILFGLETEWNILKIGFASITLVIVGYRSMPRHTINRADPYSLCMEAVYLCPLRKSRIIQPL